VAVTRLKYFDWDRFAKNPQTGKYHSHKEFVQEVDDFLMSAEVERVVDIHYEVYDSGMGVYVTYEKRAPAAANW
jgi:hypothetical protein